MPDRSPWSAPQPLLVHDLHATAHRFATAFNLSFQHWAVSSESGPSRPGLMCRRLTRGIQPVVLLQALAHETRHPLDLTVLHASPSLALQQALAAGFLPVRRPQATASGFATCVASVCDPDNHVMVDIEAAFNLAAPALP